MIMADLESMLYELSKIYSVFFVGTLLLTTNYAMAKSDYEIEASGKNKTVALSNLKIQALRTEIARHLSQNEIKSNAKIIRAEFFLKMDDYVSQIGEISYIQDEKKVTAKGRISVDDEKMLAVLKKALPNITVKMNETNSSLVAQNFPATERDISTLNKSQNFSEEPSAETTDKIRVTTASDNETHREYQGQANPDDTFSNMKINENGSKFIEVQVEGIGESHIDALKNAWSEAVRQAVGVYMISNEKVIDDELVENIATYSKGQVESYQLLKSDKLADGWHVEILAKIEKDLLNYEIQLNDSQKRTFSFDGTNEVAKKSSKEEKEKNATDVISSLNKLDIKDTIIYRAELRKGKVDGKNINYFRHYIGLDVKKYLNKIEQLSKALEKIAKSKKSFYFNNDAIKANKIAMNFDNMLDYFKDKNFSIYPNTRFLNNNAFKGLTNNYEFIKTERNKKQCAVMVYSPSKLTVYCFDGDIENSIRCLFPKELDLVFTQGIFNLVVNKL